jgi:polysaccharide biosynthesis/export protein
MTIDRSPFLAVVDTVNRCGITSDGGRTHRGRCVGWRCAVIAVGLATLLVGCRSTSSSTGERFTHKTMPEYLVAAKRANAKTINLAGLASTAHDSELIDKGDVIEVTIATGLNEKEVRPVPVRVDDNGIANIPVVGPVPLAGQEPQAAEATIIAACIERQLYVNPNVTVTMKQQRLNRVTVIGAVMQPGVKAIPKGQSDLLAALTAAGGLAADAGTEVEIKNPSNSQQTAPGELGKEPDPIASTDDGVSTVGHSTPARPVSSKLQTIKVDLVSATREGKGGYQIEDGAIVMVEKRDPEPIHVLGLVQKPNRYEMPVGQDLTLLNAISLAGGVSSPVANKVFVVRKKPHSDETVIIEETISEAKKNELANLRLAPGDVVSVEQTPATIILDAIRIINFGFGASLPLTAF